MASQIAIAGIVLNRAVDQLGLGLAGLWQALCFPASLSGHQPCGDCLGDRRAPDRSRNAGRKYLAAANIRASNAWPSVRASEPPFFFGQHLVQTRVQRRLPTKDMAKREVLCAAVRQPESAVKTSSSSQIYARLQDAFGRQTSAARSTGGSGGGAAWQSVIMSVTPTTQSKRQRSKPPAR